MLRDHWDAVVIWIWQYGSCGSKGDTRKFAGVIRYNNQWDTFTNKWYLFSNLSLVKFKEMKYLIAISYSRCVWFWIEIVLQLSTGIPDKNVLDILWTRWILYLPVQHSIGVLSISGKHLKISLTWSSRKIQGKSSYLRLGLKTKDLLILTCAQKIAKHPCYHISCFFNAILTWVYLIPWTELTSK